MSRNVVANEPNGRFMGWSSYIEMPGKVMNLYYTLHQPVYQTMDSIRNDIPLYA